MYPADRPLTLLYVINVMQPVELSPIKEGFRRLTVEVARSGPRQEGFDRILDSLVHRGHVRRKGKRYYVTATGLRKLTVLGLGHVRDKNRLLLLNKLL